MNNFKRCKLHDRYLNDAEFHKVVNLFINLIESNGYTPSEMREALFLAHYKYEMENPRHTDIQSFAQIEEYFNSIKNRG
jgi:hypothetical protein